MDWLPLAQRQSVEQVCSHKVGMVEIAVVWTLECQFHSRPCCQCLLVPGKASVKQLCQQSFTSRDTHQILYTHLDRIENLPFQ